MTKEQVRTDLKDIRYYYANKKIFDKFYDGESRAEKLCKKYKIAVMEAPAKLASIYIGLYVNNNTCEALAYDMERSFQHISRLNSELMDFLANYFNRG